MKDLKIEKKKKLFYNVSIYGIIILGFILLKIFQFTNHISSLMNGLLVPFCFYSILSISLNLILGISGDLSLGHAGFMCIGAFSSAIFTKYFSCMGVENNLVFIFSIIIASINVCIISILVGIPIFKLKGDYFAIVTLALGEIIKNFFNNIYLAFDNNSFHLSFKSVSNLNLSSNSHIIIKGAQGISGIPNYSTFLISIILLLIITIISINLINSSFGRSVQSSRDNLIAAKSIGIDSIRNKIEIFVIANIMAGIAGVLYAHNLPTLTSTSKNFGYNMSISILVMVIFGGIGNIRGSIISSIILTILPEILRFLQDYRMLIYSILLILSMLFTNAPKFIKYRKNILSKIKKIKKNTKRYFIKRKILKRKLNER